LFNGYTVKHVMNITDVGHLTSDADDGEDKMLKGARREKKTVWEIAEYYTKSFKDDIQKLHILPPTIWSKATDHIKEQIGMVQQLEKKGFTYTAGGNVYFDTSKCKDYGKLVGLTTKGKARVKKDAHKKNPHDFVLWFTKSKFIDQEMQWDSPFGKGYPGWHVECSAMASKYLGKQFDIHTGGQDLAPVHHTNEIAQAESAYGKEWVRYWLHNEFVVLGKGEKMSKSAENFFTLAKLEEKGFSAVDYRYFCLGTHYRNPLMFSVRAIESARTGRKKLFDRVLELHGAHGKDKKVLQKKYLNRFTAEVNDDMNTPQALATMWEVLKDKELGDHDKHFLLLQFDKVFGFNLGTLKKEKLPAAVLQLAKEREKLREERNWKKADALRAQIGKLGYTIDDGEEGYDIRKT
jgi:cysteinyl-tRNA synthetase